jgi:hypothetical protein
MTAQPFFKGVRNKSVNHPVRVTGKDDQVSRRHSKCVNEFKNLSMRFDVISADSK